MGIRKEKEYSDGGLIQYIDPLLDNLKSVLSYRKIDFASKEQKETYDKLKQRYGFAYFFLIFAGMTGIHRVYLKSAFFAFYFIIFWQSMLGGIYDKYTDNALSIMCLCILDFFLMPIHIALQNLRLKKAIIEGTPVGSQTISEFFCIVTASILLTPLDSYFNVPKLWTTFLNWH